jgi:hypothetical protein
MLPARSTLRSLLSNPRTDRRVPLALALALFVLVIPGTALGYLAPGGGVVFVPVKVALLGAAGAAVAGYRRDGLLPAWVVTFAALEGFYAHWAFFGLGYRDLLGQLAFFVSPELFAVNAVTALVFGSVGAALGALCRWTHLAARRYAGAV